MFLNHQKIQNLTSELNFLKCKNNIFLFLIYGSTLHNETNPKDTDIIIILNKAHQPDLELVNFLSTNFHNLDLHIYSYEEIISDIAFYEKEYMYEYLSHGLVLYGSNIFIDKHKKTSLTQYKKSIILRSIEHIRRVRIEIYSAIFSEVEKIEYIKKYINRISKNIFLYSRKENCKNLMKLEYVDVLILMVHYRLIDVEIFEIVDYPHTLQWFIDIFNKLVFKINFLKSKDFSSNL